MSADDVAGSVPGIGEVIAENLRDDVNVTDTGNGQLLVDLYGHLLRYATDSDRWYVWNGTHWEEETDRALRVFALTQAVVRHLRAEAERNHGEDDTDEQRERRVARVMSLEAVDKRNAMIKVARTDARVQVEEEDFDVAPQLLVCRNGVVDLDTGELRSARPEDMLSRCCAVAYDPVATSPELDVFLETFLPVEEDQRFVFAVLGHALRAGNPHRLLPIFYGDTTSGKSQLFAALHRLLGSYVCTIGSSVFRGNLDDKPRPDLVKAMFTRIAFATEASKSWALHADQVKRLTGGDPLPYRNLYQGIVNKLPRFTPMMVTNEFPRITNADWPTKRRILALHFDRSVERGREDPSFKERFTRDENCLRALLTRLVTGARDDIMTDPTLIPQKYVLATMNARGDIDHTDEFLAWMTDEGYLADAPPSVAATTCVRTGELHACYRYWLDKYGDNVDRSDRLSLKGLSRSLQEKGWESTRSAGTRWVGKVLTGVPEWIKFS